MANVLILESSLKLVPQCNHWLFFGIILIISVFALVGNVLAIRSIITRKQKYLQKVCIISLALADIFSIVMFATNNLDALTRELKIWKLGEFLCHFIPMGQVLGTTASSVALLVIAIDRYQNVTTTIVSKRWNPSLWRCSLIAILLLIVCSVISYPMYVFFTFNQIQVVYTNGTHYSFEDAFLCAAIEKDKLRLYYIIMSLMIFLPIIAVFIWFYYQIAAMVWRHRKPVTSKYQDTPKPDISVSSFGTPKLVTRRTKTAQVQRKIRTFKVIIVLMVSFTVCRLPYWIFFVVKLVETRRGSTIWYFNLALIALNMLNCALNPLLYAFLNETIHAARKCHDLMCRVAMCCCCYTDGNFEGLRNHNSFIVNYDGKKEGVEKEGNITGAKIKFIDSQLPVYP